MKFPLTQNKLNVTLLVALEEQKKREALSKEKYDFEQRIEAVIQIAEQKLNRKLDRKEVRCRTERLVFPSL
jgi:hypothetical protein